MIKKIFTSKLFYILVVCSILIGLLFTFLRPITGFFNGTPISYIKFSNNLRFTSVDLIRQAITKSDNTNKGYFSFDINKFRDQMMQYDWIKNLTIRKIWPNIVILNITELQPYAYWTNGLQVGYITKSGKLFYSPAQLQANDSFKGIVTKVEEYQNLVDSANTKISKLNSKPNGATLAVQKQSQSMLAQETKKLAPLLEQTFKASNYQSKMPIFISNKYYIPLSLDYWHQVEKELGKQVANIKEIRVDSSDSWRIMLKDGIVLKLDAVNIPFTMQRYLLAAQQIIVPPNYFISYIDLRYNNGLAIKFVRPEEVRANPKLVIPSLIPYLGGSPLANAEFNSSEIKGDYTDDLQ